MNRVLYKIFYEPNGKMFKVKRAVPKEFSPGNSELSMDEIQQSCVNQRRTATNKTEEDDELGIHFVTCNLAWAPM